MGPWWIRGRMLFMSLRLRSGREEDEKRQSVFPHGQAGGLVGLDAPKRMAVQALMQEPCATDHDLSALLEAQDVAPKTLTALGLPNFFASCSWDF